MYQALSPRWDRPLGLEFMGLASGRSQPWTSEHNNWGATGAIPPRLFYWPVYWPVYWPGAEPPVMQRARAARDRAHMPAGSMYDQKPQRLTKRGRRRSSTMRSPPFAFCSSVENLSRHVQGRSDISCFRNVSSRLICRDAPGRIVLEEAANPARP